MWKGLMISGIATFALGCGGTPPNVPPPAPVRAADAALLEPLLLAEKPLTPRDVADVRDNAKDGEEVVLVGKVPPGDGRGFLRDRAGFVLMAVDDIEKNRKNLDCTDAD